MDQKTKHQIQKTILAKLEEEFEFQPHPEAEIEEMHITQLQEFGFLLRKFRLDEIRVWCDLSEAHDDQILKILDDLSAKRKIKVLRAGIRREMHHNDIEFIAEIGRAIQQPRRFTVGMELAFKFFYWEPRRAITKKEFNNFNPLEKPSIDVKNIRERRDQYFRERFGHSNEMEIERRLHREALLKEIADKREIPGGNSYQS